MDESLLWPVGISGLQPDKNRCCVNKCITAFSHGLRNEYLRSEGEAWPSERLLLRRILQTCSGSLDTTKGVVQIRKAGNFHASVSLRSRPVNPFFRCGRPASAPCPWRTQWRTLQQPPSSVSAFLRQHNHQRSTCPPTGNRALPTPGISFMLSSDRIARCSLSME